MSWRGLRPGRGCAIPRPGVIEVLAVVSAEQNYLLQLRIVGRAGSRSRRGLHRSPDPFPVRAVEGPGVIEVPRTIEPAEHDNLLADRIVEHHAGGARPRHSLRMESYPCGSRDLAECGADCGKYSERDGGGTNGRPQDKAGKISHWDISWEQRRECITQFGGDSSGNACLARDLSIAVTWAAAARL